MKEKFGKSGQRVSFKTDTWMSIQNLTYTCITTYWIDSEWTLYKQIIWFKQIENHKSSSVRKKLDDCMKYWRINKGLCITTNNASVNDNSIEWLKRNTIVTKNIVRDNEFYYHVSWATHILYPIVIKGLKEVDESILKVRNLVRYVKDSP